MQAEQAETEDPEVTDAIADTGSDTESITEPEATKESPASVETESEQVELDSETDTDTETI